MGTIGYFGCPMTAGDKSSDGKGAAGEAAATSERQPSHLDNAIGSVWAREAAAPNSAPAPQDYLKDLIKTVPLFMSGRGALASAAVLHALDAAKPSDDAGTQVADGLFGAAKGAAMKATFDKIGGMNTNFAIKGLGMGMTARTLDVGLTRGTYYQDGQFSFMDGIKKTASTTFAKDNLIADAAITGLGFGGLKALNASRFGHITESRFFGTVLPGTVFGASSGAYQEVQRQSRAGTFDPLALAKETFLNAGLGGVAAVPGGFQAAVRYNPRDYGPVSMAESKANFERLHSPVEKNVPITERSGAKWIYKSAQEFWDIGLHKPLRPVREYSISGHETKLHVPIEFDNALGRLRTTRDIASQPMFDKGWWRLDHSAKVAGARLRLDTNSHNGRFLPEDLITGLDRSPDRTMINDILYRPDVSPYSYRVGRFREVNQAVAEMLAGGKMVFYKPPKGWNPTSTLQHEWAHIQQDRNPTAYAAFHAALKLEEYGWDHHGYAKTNVAENWAVNSEVLLGTNQARFNTMAEQAPIRTAVFGRALKEILDAVPPDARGPNYGDLQARVNHIRQNVEPRAVQQLNERTGNGDPTIQNSAKIMKDFLSGKITPERAQKILGQEWKYDYFREHPDFDPGHIRE